VLKDFGNSVGTAFQIIDDLLDLLAKRKDIGKPAGRDLEKGKLTLPVIIMLAKNPSLRPDVRAAIANNDRAALHGLLKSTGSINAAFDVVGNLVDDAVSGVKNVLSNESSVQLCKLAEQLKRSF
jgi:geranylgeranyl pyrophosphate synthase